MYFDQQTQACACICVAQNYKKYQKLKKNNFFHYAYETLTYVRLNQASTQAMPSHAFKAAQLKTPTKTEGYSMSSSKLL